MSFLNFFFELDILHTYFYMLIIILNILLPLGSFIVQFNNDLQLAVLCEAANLLLNPAADRYMAAWWITFLKIFYE
jgi:hypothetical protein